MRTLSVETRWDGDEATVLLTGELDLSTAPGRWSRRSPSPRRSARAA